MLCFGTSPIEKIGALGFQKEVLVPKAGVSKRRSGLRKKVVILAREILEVGKYPKDQRDACRQMPGDA